jgi:Protein of unknown function (DUF3263)
MLVFRARRGQHRALMQIELTPREQAMLDFEREWWHFDGRKEHQIRARFDVSPSSYYRTLQGLIEMDAASDYDPLTVKRLRRQRDQRRRVRHEGRRADPGSR